MKAAFFLLRHPQSQIVDCTLFRFAHRALEPIPGKARIEDYVGDIEKPDNLCDIISKVDLVFHFAAQTSTYVGQRIPWEICVST